MISEAEPFLTNELEYLINLDSYSIHQTGAKLDQLT